MCIWKRIPDIEEPYYETSCGKDFCFEEHEDLATNSSNGFKHCPFCAELIAEAFE